jgi:hypothetical protein
MPVVLVAVIAILSLLTNGRPDLNKRQQEILSIEAFASWGRLGQRLASSVDRLESSRRLAALYVALHDTVTTIRPGKFGGYWYSIMGYPSGASGQAAIAGAASTVLTEFFPANATEIAAKYEQYSMGAETDAAIRDGMLAGELVGRSVMRSMQSDGSSDIVSPLGDSTFRPQWASLQPWCILVGPRRRKKQTTPRGGGGGGGIFLLDEPLPVDYRGDADIQMALAASSSSTSTVDFRSNRPEWITEAALSASLTAMLEFEDTARLLALTSMSLADASILAWAVKHQYDTPTTTTVIRNLSVALSGWTPQQPGSSEPEDVGSPGDYCDLHSTVAGAGLTILSRIFGSAPPFPILLGPSPSSELVSDFDATIASIARKRAESGAVFNTSSVQGSTMYGSAVGNWIYDECLPREPMTTASMDTQATDPPTSSSEEDNNTDSTYDPYTDPPWPVSDFMDVRRMGFLLACCLFCILVTAFISCCCTRCRKTGRCKRSCAGCRNRCSGCCKRTPPYVHLNPEIEMGHPEPVV